jgi:hypothetical protein
MRLANRRIQRTLHSFRPQCFGSVLQAGIVRMCSAGHPRMSRSAVPSSWCFSPLGQRPACRFGPSGCPDQATSAGLRVASGPAQVSRLGGRSGGSAQGVRPVVCLMRSRGVAVKLGGDTR